MPDIAYVPPAPLTQAPASGPGSTQDGGLAIRDLKLWVQGKRYRKDILHGISFDAPRGQITGLAGESGSGKTMTGLAVCGLTPDNFRASGAVYFEGQNLLDLSRSNMNKLRGVRIAMIFQDPIASLHPMLNVGSQLTDHLRYHRGIGKKEALQRAEELLERVHVPHPREALHKYPHQFSGGQLQRVAIASALACGPDVLIADEPTTALDVTVQAGILRLLRHLCDELNLAIVLVTHDLGVMSALADNIQVMRDGLIVEAGARRQIIQQPVHEYTRALIDALPVHELPGQDIAGGGAVAVSGDALADGRGALADGGAGAASSGEGEPA